MSRLIRVVAAGLLAAACTTTVAPTDHPTDESPPAPTATAAPTSDASPPVDGPVQVAAKPLAETLAYLPAAATQVDFTNWSLMLAAEGLPSPGSRLSEEQRRDFLGRLFGTTPHRRPSLTTSSTSIATSGAGTTPTWTGRSRFTSLSEGPTCCACPTS